MSCESCSHFRIHFGKVTVIIIINSFVINDRLTQILKVWIEHCTGRSKKVLTKLHWAAIVVVRKWPYNRSWVYTSLAAITIEKIRQFFWKPCTTTTISRLEDLAECESVSKTKTGKPKIIVTADTPRKFFKSKNQVASSIATAASVSTQSLATSAAAACRQSGPGCTGLACPAQTGPPCPARRARWPARRAVRRAEEPWCRLARRRGSALESLDTGENIEQVIVGPQDCFLFGRPCPSVVTVNSLSALSIKTVIHLIHLKGIFQEPFTLDCKLTCN